MRKYIRIITALMLIMSVLVLTGCGGNNDSVEEADASEEVQTETQDAASDAGSGDTLVIYFSATGNTKAVAEKIASITGADIYEIKAAQEYTDADLDWNDANSRATTEQNDLEARPEIGGEDIDLSNYSTVFIGYPIWFGQEPRIMDTFVESHDFAGKKVIPFCTSGSSDIGQSGDSMAEKAGTGDWQAGKRFSGGASEDDVRSWIDSL